MALLNFPASPFNGEIYPVSPPIGQNQYTWEASTSTWRLIGPVATTSVGFFGSATSVGRFSVDLQGKVTYAEDIPLNTSFIALNNPAAYNSYIWPNADGAAGTVLTTDGAGNLSWEIARPDAGLGLVYDGNYLKVSLPINSTPPTVGSGQQQAVPGSVYWDSTLGQLFIYYDDGITAQWVTTSPTPEVPDPGLGITLDGSYFKLSVPTQSAPPTAGSLSNEAVDGSLYYDSTIGQLFVRFNDGTTTQWVTTCPVTDVPGAGLGIGLQNNNFKSSIPSLSGPPTVGTGSNEAMTGSVYFDTNYGSFFYYYFDGFTYQWVQVV